jgi:hypothetical protein
MKLSHARRAVLAVAATALLTTACSGATYPTREAARRTATTQVAVKNHNWMDMTIYAMRDGSSRIRIGSVVSGTTERFQLPLSFDLRTGGLRLMADPVGSGETFTSEPIYAESGSVVNWTIENHIQLSSFFISSR